MINYSCRYTPIELFESFFIPSKILENEEADFELAESLTHANLCSHAKALIQQGNQSENLILMDCCDSLRKSFDVLKETGNLKFLKLMDLPHDSGECGRERFKEELIELSKELETLTGKKFNKNAFIKSYNIHRKNLPNKDYIAILGARISPQLELLIEDTLNLPVVNLTCSGIRDLGELPEDILDLSEEEFFDWYSQSLLQMIPCMRMIDIASRKRLINDPHLKGIVYNTVKFCDFYNFDYANIKKLSDLKILKIESDFMPQPAGQLSTRLEAFNESLNPEIKETKKMKTQNGLYAGIDSGSTTTNMVVINQDKEILASSIVRTGAKAQNGAQKALEDVCNQLNITPDKLDVILATGYGRNNIEFKTDTKTEISCHAKGAYFLNPQIRTIVDIGGQDSKVICLDETGNVTNFIMNDKCAAGTGRFLEMMARTLEMELPEMSQKGLIWDKDLTISSMCTVFAESEVISLIADNNTDSDIIHGLNKSIATKTASMVKRAKGKENFMMTGGVARNEGVKKEIERKLEAELFTTDTPDLCGALGAALFALEGE